MVDIMTIENDPTIKLNTPDAKICREIAEQFLAKRSGKLLKTQKVHKAVEIMLKYVEDIEGKQGEALLELIKKLKITEEHGYKAFSNVCDETLRTEVSWGRITSLHLFAALLAEDLRKNGKDSLADKVGLWLGVCIAKRSSWIRNEGRGWDGFAQMLHGHKEVENNVFKGLFHVTLGLGTVAAALFIQAK